MKSWSPETILQLIRLFHDHSILWDNNHPHSKQSDLKQAAWIEISEIMKRTDVEKKMNILLVQFRREMKKLRDLQTKCLKGENDKPLKSKWFAFDAMYFLKDKMRKHKQLNIPPNQEIPMKANTARKEKVKSLRKQTSQFENVQVLDAEETNQMTFSQASSSKDEYSAFGELVAIKIRNLPTARSKSRAMNVITNALFELESECMQVDSEIGEDSVVEFTETVYLKHDEVADDT